MIRALFVNGRKTRAKSQLPGALRYQPAAPRCISGPRTPTCACRLHRLPLT